MECQNGNLEGLIDTHLATRLRLLYQYLCQIPIMIFCYYNFKKFTLSMHLFIMQYVHSPDGWKLVNYCTIVPSLFGFISSVY